MGAEKNYILETIKMLKRNIYLYLYAIYILSLLSLVKFKITTKKGMNSSNYLIYPFWWYIFIHKAI